MGFINQFKNAINNLKKNYKPFDPATLNDDIAIKTQWTPAKRGGSNFKTHDIVKTSPYRLEIRPGKMTLLFPVIFILAGLAPAVAFLFLNDTGQPLTTTVIPIIIGIIFLGVGLAFFYFMRTPHFFDKSVGYYWKGKKESNLAHEAKINCRLSEIHALQIISEYIRNRSNTGSGRSYHSYEINLVLKNGDRINVLDHGARNKLFQQAEELSQFLNVPVWNAVRF